MAKNGKLMLFVALLQPGEPYVKFQLVKLPLKTN